LLFGSDRYQKLRFEEDKELDFSFGVRGVARFRANLFMQRGAVGGAFRTVPFKIATFADLGLPASSKSFATSRAGWFW
jgi:twitching motility protein PilT